jgi:hypothetical protein
LPTSSFFLVSTEPDNETYPAGRARANDRGQVRKGA